MFFEMQTKMKHIVKTMKCGSLELEGKKDLLFLKPPEKQNEI